MNIRRDFKLFQTYCHASSDGGEEVILLENDWSRSGPGALVITTWGSDYGGGVDKAYDLNGPQLDAFKSLPDRSNSYTVKKWLSENCSQFELMPEKVNPQIGEHHGSSL